MTTDGMESALLRNLEGIENWFVRSVMGNGSAINLLEIEFGWGLPYAGIYLRSPFQLRSIGGVWGQLNFLSVRG